MPEVSAYEMKRLITIRDNHFLLKELCGPGESVYEFHNSKALLDAVVALETGRLRTPTPSGSTTTQTDDSNVKERDAEDSVDMRNGATSSTVDVVKVPQLTNSLGRSTRVLRTRKKVETVTQKTGQTSEEEEDTATDSDEDFVEGILTASSSSESESEEAEDDNDEDCEESDADVEDSEDEINLEGPPPQARKLKRAVTGEEGSTGISKPRAEDISLPAPSNKEGRETSAKGTKQGTLSMDKSKEEEDRVKQGFETWSTGKKSRKSESLKKKIVPRKSKERNESPAMTVHGRSLPTASELVLVKKKKKKSRGGKGDAFAEEGTVIISEKEYQMLLRLKQKSTSNMIGNSSDNCQQTSEKKDDIFLPDEPLVVGDDEGQEEKKLLGEASFSGKEDGDEGISGKGKMQIQSIVSPVDEYVRQEDVQEKGNRKNMKVIPAKEENSSDSDFEKLPQRSATVGRSGKVSMQVSPKQGAVRGGVSNTVLLPQRDYREENTTSLKRRLQLQQTEDNPGESEQEVAKLISRTATEKKHKAEQVAGKKKSVFAFEEKVEDRAVVLAGVGGSSPVCVVSDDDNDFQEIPHSDRHHREIVQKPQVTEAEARANRKRKKAGLDLAVRKRESAGHKPFYIMVNGIGTPYGDGLSAWKAEVNKLSRGLDPSVRDIRQQPHQKIQILKKRLMDKFDYNAVISDKFLLPLIGQRVSSRRNELMNLIRAGKDRPSGLDEDVWERLMTISQSSNFKKKSAAMRYANACRHNVGRTGPGGEIGVRDSLKKVLRRSPDPEEVQAEMTRDKGYGGKKRKTKKMAVRERTREDVDIVECEEGLSGNEEEEEKECLGDKMSVERKYIGQSSCLEGEKDSPTDQMQLMKKLLFEIEKLKARMEVSVPQQPVVRVEGAVQLVTSMPPASSCAAVNEKDDPVVDTPTSLLKRNQGFL